MEQDKPYANSLREESNPWPMASLRHPHHISFDPDSLPGSCVPVYGLGLLTRALDAMGLKVLLLTIGSCSLTNLPHRFDVRAGRRTRIRCEIRRRLEPAHFAGKSANGNSGKWRLAI